MTIDLVQAVGICASAWLVAKLVSLEYGDRRILRNCTCTTEGNHK
ncbi:hypothetical protein [Gordonia sp. SND2]